MKSYILGPIMSPEAAGAALGAVLPGQKEPWLLKDDTGDAMAYFYLAEPDGMTAEWTLVADISGRHYNRDADVISILEKLKTKLGGEITYAP